MKALWWIPACLVVCLIAIVVPIVALAGSSDGFDAVVNSIESRYHAHAMRIPFLSVVSLIAHQATNGGVSAVHVAEFDNFTAPVDGDELKGILARNIGTGWQQIIRDTNRGDGKRRAEQTLIFARPEGQSMGLFVLDLNGHELDVVQASVDPDHLNQSIARYRHRHRHRNESD